jgi:DNA-binding protein HU-beta
VRKAKLVEALATRLGDKTSAAVKVKKTSVPTFRPGCRLQGHRGQRWVPKATAAKRAPATKAR